MKKGIFIFVTFVLTVADAFAVNVIPKRFTTVTSHDDVYPYVLNNTKTNTNTKSTASATARRGVTSRSNAARATTQATTNTVQSRRVVQRTNKSARSATTKTTTMTRNNDARRVATPTQIRKTNSGRTTTTTSNTTNNTSSQHCFADYKECMEGYCEREETAYNRCYCSAKLAQIDAKYQNKIDDLTQQIVRLKYNTDATDAEIKEYWNQTVGIYTNDNPWVNIDNALNIEWADMQSRVQGQKAFNTGHQYCIQHLRSCYYMASNLRDAYKSEIARDCETYEKSLQKIQDAAESVIESYKQ